MQNQQLCHRALQRKGGSLLEAGDAVQIAEVRGVLSGCFKIAGGWSRGAQSELGRKRIAPFEKGGGRPRQRATGDLLLLLLYFRAKANPP
jgi:hypothetical protein